MVSAVRNTLANGALVIQDAIVCATGIAQIEILIGVADIAGKHFGAEPNFPFDPGDCRQERFHDSFLCTDEELNLDSVVLGTCVLGLVIATVKNIADRFF